MVIGIMISILSANVSLFLTARGGREKSLSTLSIIVLDLRGKFSAIHREYSPNPRKFYAFCTSVTDTATTAGIIASGTFLISFPLPLPGIIVLLFSARHGYPSTSQTIQSVVIYNKSYF